MRFKSSIRNITTLTKFAAPLSSLNKIAWVRLDNDQVRFTIIPEQGTQVWAVLSIDTIFETYNIESAAPNNTINLELPLVPFYKALRSAYGATSASLRLTKRDNIPLLSLTIVTNTLTSSGHTTVGLSGQCFNGNNPELSVEDDVRMNAGPHRDRETTITQDIPVRVMSAATGEGLHEPRCREPDVHILLPSLLQLKSISERFTKLGLLATTTNNNNLNSDTNTRNNGLNSTAAGPKLELCANMHGELRLGIRTDALKCESNGRGWIIRSWIRDIWRVDWRA
ncbi:Checkpoint protein Hus1/Mec3 [Lasallia pustulata]|uniref:Checkpoint protein n=1 Tax=Lasallia pustulata TaxID=136370 RepID=A0A1W5CTI4_9LECA|nr:Checkpoint protein Hus1/Mec3 [Lasallia pustulata]